tara:strand:- start:28393 stop:28824 length:432 start_codon:yes stop_codon:yes gene_type:complete
MKIEKKYHFYAAHRNQNLTGKCSSLHGHRYGVTVVIEAPRTRAGVTMLFADIDIKAGSVLQAYDHAAIIDRRDEVWSVIMKQTDHEGMPMRCVVLDCESSAENLAGVLFDEMLEAGLPIVELRLQETDSATVIYTLEDRNEQE